MSGMPYSRSVCTLEHSADKTTATLRKARRQRALLKQRGYTAHRRRERKRRAT